MLDRIGDEVARATSVVRYAPGSRFSPHVHDKGEEFLVLEGLFQDEHGDYPEGSYVRNPPGSRHSPRSDQGCVILVKLRQFDPSDRTQVRRPSIGRGVEDLEREGVLVTELFRDAREQVRVETWERDTEVSVDCSGGAELFVLDGSFRVGPDELRIHSWMRVPVGGSVRAKSGSSGARVWVKTGHLADAALHRLGA